MCRMLRHLDMPDEKHQAQPTEHKWQHVHFFDTVDVDALQELGTFNENGCNQVTKAFKQVPENSNYNQSTAQGRRPGKYATTTTFAFPE